MATSVNALPLLHKYVLSPHDDIELRMTKLKFRLCVKEVSDLQQLRGRGVDLTHDDDSPSPLDGKTDDSGLENDFCVADNSRCEANLEEIPVEFDASRLGDSVIDETYDTDNEDEEEQEQERTMQEEEEEEEQKQQQQQKFITMSQGDGFEIQNAPIDAIVTGSALTTISAAADPALLSTSDVVPVPCLTADGNPAIVDGERVEKTKSHAAQDPVPVAESSTETAALRHPEKPLQNGAHSAMENQLKISSRSPTNGEKKSECSDVLEALRILKTRSELPKVTTRKSAAGAFSSWNFADLKRGPQQPPAEYVIEYSEQTIKRKSELEATNDRILNKDRRINEMYKKIKERDEEDQRMMEKLMRKQTVPDAQPLQPPVTTTTITTSTAPPGNSDTLPKSLQAGEEGENQTPRSKDGTPQRKSTPETEEEEEGPAKKKKKKRKRQGSFLQNMANSVQRRFSRRGRETVT